MIMKGDRQVCESLYDRKPDWAPEWPEVQPGGEVEPPWALKGSPVRAETAFGLPNGTAGAASSSNTAGDHWGQQQQQQPQQQFQIDPSQQQFQIDPRLDPRLDGSSSNQQHQPNNHAIARLAPMSVSSSEGDYSYGGDGSVDYANGSNNVLFMDGTNASAAAVAAAEAHGLGVPGPSTSHQREGEQNNDDHNSNFN